MVAASIHQPGVTDPDAENESVRPSFGQRAAAIHHRGRISSPDVGDAGGYFDLAGGREDDARGRKSLTREGFADPDGAVAHLFDLGHGTSQVGRP